MRIAHFVRQLMSVVYTFIGLVSLRNFESGIKVNGFSWFSTRTKIGEDSHFNGFRVYGRGKVVIGKCFHSGEGCEVITDVHNYHSDKLPYGDDYIIKDVIVGDYVWLGKGVTLLGGVTIGTGAIVQAKSVVVSDVPPMAIVGGHPAKVFAYRDKEHFVKLVNSVKSD